MSKSPSIPLPPAFKRIGWSKPRTKPAKRPTKSSETLAGNRPFGAYGCDAPTTFRSFFQQIATENRHQGWMRPAVIVNRWKTLGMQ